MNPQMLQAMMQGQLTKDGSGADSASGLGSMLSGVSNSLAPMLLMLAGMGVRELPRLFNSIMDLQSMGKEDPQDQPGALPTPAEPSLPSPPGMAGAMPPPGMPGAGGGMPPGLAAQLMQMAAQRQMGNQ